MKKITLKDVASKLGVSTATVSNAFNRPDQLSNQLREHILQQCKELGYFGPNAAARSLKMGKSGIIGVVLSDRLQYSFTDPIAKRFLAGIAEVFDKAKVNLLLLPSREEFYQDRPFDTFGDGFILYGTPNDPNTLQRFLGHNKPVVTVDMDIENYVFIHVDNENAAKEMAEHAVSRPYTQAAILGLKLTPSENVCRIRPEDLYDKSSSVSRRRLAGYQSAFVAQNGKELEKEWIWSIPENEHEPAYQAAREALMCHPRPDLILCSSDRIALTTMEACRELNIRVPEDIRIYGFDDIPEAREAGLTTVHQPQNTKGRIAAEMILGQRPLKNHIVNTKLVLRDSG